MAEKTDAIALTLSACKHAGIVCVDGRAGETIITAKADGTLVAGKMVGVLTTIGATLGDIDGIIDGGFETVMGILLPKYNVDCDTPVADGKVVEIVIPKAGRHYNVAIKNPGAAIAAGRPFVYAGAGDTDGSLTLSTDVLIIAVCRAARGIADTSLFGEMIWGPN